MLLSQQSRRLLFTFVGIFFVLLIAFTGHQQHDTLADFRDKAFETVGRPRQHQHSTPWLLATMSPAHGLQRRTIIRSTWQRLFANSTRFDTRFVIANATDLWRPLIEAENATYGDLIMLPSIAEDRQIAISIKPMTFFSWLVNTTRSNNAAPYKFVSKVDDDSFIEPKLFYDRYLAPALDRSPNNTLWGSMIGNFGKYNFTFPQGQFYTMEWDVLSNITSYWDKHGSEGIFDEDSLVGHLLLKAGLKMDMQALPHTGIYDYGGEGNDGPLNQDTAWAHKEANLNSANHGVAVGTFNVHHLKEDNDYLKVAACFDEDGLKLEEWTNGFIG